jgi:membrane protein DedA with SNARE-associated domain
MALYIADFLIKLVSSWGYMGIFITMTLESTLVPIPSEIVMPFAGFLSYEGRMDIWLATLVASAANLTGSMIAYMIGKYLGRGFVERYGKYVLLNMHHLQIMEGWFAKYGNITVLFSRMLPVIRSVNAVPAGIARMNIPRFCLFTFVGSVPWNLALVYVGYVLKENWGLLEKYAIYVDILAVLAIIVVIAYLARRIVSAARSAQTTTKK